MIYIFMHVKCKNWQCCCFIEEQKIQQKGADKYWSQAEVGEQSKQGDVYKEIDGFQESVPVRGIHNNI